MSELVAVVVGGLIGIGGTAVAALFAHWVNRQNRQEEQLLALHRLLGQQEAMKSRAEKPPSQEVVKAHLEQVPGFRSAFKKNPELLSYISGYVEEVNADAASLIKEGRLLEGQVREANAEALHWQQVLEETKKRVKAQDEVEFDAK